MNALGTFTADHLTAIISAASALSIAAICTMPALYPKTFQEMWTWVRDTLQTVVPAARHGQSSMSSTVQTPTTTSHVEATVANPTQAVTPPQPKES